jgi:hypothetical protein
MSGGMSPLLLLDVLAVLALAPVGSVGGVVVTAYTISIAGALLGAHFPWLPAYVAPCALLALIAAGLALRRARAASAAAIAQT